MHQGHHEIPEAKCHTAIAKGVGNGEGDDEKTRHADQHEQPQDGFAGRYRVGEPCVAAVHPPHVAEHQYYPRETECGGILGQQARELGDSEDEDKVEEQLYSRDPNVCRGVSDRHLFPRFPPKAITARKSCGIMGFPCSPRSSRPWSPETRDQLGGRIGAHSLLPLLNLYDVQSLVILQEKRGLHIEGRLESALDGTMMTLSPMCQITRAPHFFSPMFWPVAGSSSPTRQLLIEQLYPSQVTAL